MSQLSTVSIVSNNNQPRIYTNVASIDAEGEYLTICITPPKGGDVEHNIPHKHIEYYSVKAQRS